MSNQKILVIEDEPDIREIIVETLEFADYVVKAVDNGVDGVHAAKRFGPDLILCDVMLPELDGYGVLLELNQFPQTYSIPFIFLTAKATREDIRKGMTMGADDYWTKPFTSQELLDTVQTRLERHWQLTSQNAEQLDFLRHYLNLTLPHELRTPLNGITGYLYILQDGLDDMDTVQKRDVLKNIQRSVGRLTTLVENFIAYSQARVILADPAIHQKLQDLGLVKDIATIISQEAQREAYDFGRMKDLHVSLEEATGRIFYDHLRKLVSCLVNNAFKFSMEKTAVNLIGKVQDGYYKLVISNIGRGMTEAQIAKVGVNRQFDRREYEQQGAGLGLAIASQIVAIYGGKLEIESIPGETTAVSAYFPLLD